MPVKVFFSWSGPLSKSLADATKNWLPGVLQFVKPYFTPDDIEKGARWDSDISKELESSNIGLIFLTRENTTKPWILFEAGALSKKFEKARVCTLLFGLEPADLEGPLAGFQHTKFEKDDFKKLLISINKESGDSRLEAQVLDSVFDMWWPKLEQELTQIMAEYKPKEIKKGRPEREILEEILELTRLTAKSFPPSPVDPMAVEDLYEAFSMLQRAIDQQDFSSLHILSKKLEHPVQYFWHRHRVRRGGFAKLVGQLPAAKPAPKPESGT